MEVFDAETMARDFAERDAKKKKWAFWATILHDPDLPPATWTVDGVVQKDELTEETLKRAVMREGRQKPEVRLSAPLHVTVSAFMGWSPPLAKSGE